MKNTERYTCDNCGLLLSEPTTICPHCSGEFLESTPDDVAQTKRVSKPRDRIWAGVCLTYPIWGGIVFGILMCKVNGNFAYLGLMLAIPSGLPILSAKDFPVIVKAILIPIYYLVGLVFGFAFAWFASCNFCGSC